LTKLTNLTCIVTGRASHSSGSPAAAYLRERGVAFDLHKFHHDDRADDYGPEAVRQLTTALDCDPFAIFKSLVWSVDASICLALVPVPSRVAAKKLASAMNARRAELADSRTAERISGSALGAISPFSMRRRVPVVIDESAKQLDRMFVSAGRRGLEIAINPADAIAITDALVSPIAVSDGT